MTRTHPSIPPTGHRHAPTRRRVLLGLLAPAAFGVLGPGCAAPGDAAPRDDRAALLERARAYWRAVQAGDFAQAWPYEDISRDPNWTLQSYLRRVGGIVYHEVEVLRVASIEGDEAVVEVRQRYSVPLARLKDATGVAQDRWRRIDGQWYHDRRPRGPAGS